MVQGLDILLPPMTTNIDDTTSTVSPDVCLALERFDFISILIVSHLTLHSRGDIHKSAIPNSSFVSFHKGTPTKTSPSYNPNYGSPQNGTPPSPNFGRP